MKFPNTRLRRLRRNKATRSLVSDVSLSTSDLILPLFCVDKGSTKEEIENFPDVFRYGNIEIIEQIKKAEELGIQAVALFPVVEQSLKDEKGSYAFEKNNFFYKLIKNIKKEVPDILLIGDAALDPYTNHGHDGVLNKKGGVDNDKTVKTLIHQSEILVKAGIDIIAPSDMMDGRIGAIRDSLEKKKYTDTVILSYSSKYASNLYSPFREAVKSKKNKTISKETYQMSFDQSGAEINEAAMDIEEGADILMVKPAHFYQDIIYKLSQSFNVPIFAFQVSGEYSMMKKLANGDIMNFNKILTESLIALKRSGATSIITYGALEMAELIQREK